MAGSKDNQTPSRHSTDELVELFETTDMGDLIDQMPEIKAEVDLRRSHHLVELEDDIVDWLEETARDQKVSTQTLINTILREKLAEAS